MPINEATGIAGASRQSFLNAFKIQYLKMWPKSVQNEARLVALMSRGSKTTVGGKYQLSSQQYGRTESAGMGRAEYDDLPIPGQPTYAPPEVFPRSLYARGRVTGFAKRAAQVGNPGTWVKPWMEIMDDLRETHVINSNRMCHRGIYDPLGVISAYTAGTPSVTMYGPDTRTSAANDFWKNGTRSIRVGMAVAGVAASGGNVVPGGDVATGNYDTGQANRRTVTAVNPTTGVVTLSAAFATTLVPNDDNALLIPWRSRQNSPGAEGASSDSNYLHTNGLANMIANASNKDYIYNVSRGTYPHLEGNIFTAGSPRTWDEQFVNLALDVAGENIYSRDSEADCLLMQRSLRRAYVKEVENQREFTPIQTKKGWGALAYMYSNRPIPIIVDRETHGGLAWALDKSTFFKIVQTPMVEVDEGKRFVAEKDAHEIVMVEDCNYACRLTASNSRIDDFTYSNTAVPA